MKIETAKAVSKKIFINMIILSIILLLVIAITSIPTDFNIITTNGESSANMEIGEIFQSIKDNLKIFASGEVFNVIIEGKTTGQLLAETGKKSTIILLSGAILAVLIGIPKGIIDSRKKSKSGTLKLLQSLIPLSLPDIFTISLVQLFAIYLFKNEINFLGLGVVPFVGDETFLHALYPIISISILPASYIARITANTIEEEFTKPYILAARGKGCSRFRIIKNHMLKSIIFSVLSGFPTVIGIMFSSLIIVERLFYYKGIGYYLLYFYTHPLLPPYEAGVGFTFFIVTLAIFYYVVFTVFNVSKSILLPNIKSE